MEQTRQKRTAKILLATVLTFVVTLAMVFAILPQATLTAYAAGGTEVTQANVICQQYSYTDAGDYSGGSMCDTPPVEPQISHWLMHRLSELPLPARLLTG